MDRQALEVLPRKDRGKGPARRLRAANRVPAIVYGSGVDATAVQVDVANLERLLHRGANALIGVSGLPELEGKLVLVQEFLRDPVSLKLLHCDFYSVDVEKQIHVAVPIQLEGRPVGVELGGVLEPLMREVEVRCMPLAIPESVFDPPLAVAKIPLCTLLHSKQPSLCGGWFVLIPSIPHRDGLFEASPAIET